MCVRRGNSRNLAPTFQIVLRTQLESAEVVISSQLSPGLDEDALISWEMRE